MEYETLASKKVTEYCDKVFCGNDIELKQAVQMDLLLNPDDPEDKEKIQRILNQMTKEHQKDTELLESIQFLTYDGSGNLVPYKGFEKKIS